MVQLIVESWIWWGFVIVVAASRFVSRRMTLGAFRKFQLDDYLMLLAIAFYTTLIVCINIVAHTSSNLLPPGYDVHALTPSDIAQRMYGSKLILVVEQCQCATIWAVKGCLILMYLRITTLSKVHLAVKLLGIYIVVTFVVMEILYFGVWCQPFWEYWAVPTNNVQCDAATNHLITNACFNLTSDCLMLAIGLPMFLRMKISWQKKLPLILIFSLGIFDILAAVLNKVYSFTQPFGSAWTYWYVRESSTAMLVANLPFVWNCWRYLLGITSISADDAAFTVPDEPDMHEAPNAATVLPKDPERGDSAISPSSPVSSETKDMSLEEWLTDAACAAVDRGGPINPYTHPALFFAQNRAATNTAAMTPAQVPRPDMARVVTVDSPPRDTIRRGGDANPDEKFSARSPVSSVFPSCSLGSKRSADSFV